MGLSTQSHSPPFAARPAHPLRSPELPALLAPETRVGSVRPSQVPAIRL